MASYIATRSGTPNIQLMLFLNLPQGLINMSLRGVFYTLEAVPANVATSANLQSVDFGDPSFRHQAILDCAPQRPIRDQNHPIYSSDINSLALLNTGAIRVQTPRADRHNEDGTTTDFYLTGNGWVLGGHRHSEGPVRTEVQSHERNDVRHYWETGQRSSLTRAIAWEDTPAARTRIDGTRIPEYARHTLSSRDTEFLNMFMTGMGKTSPAPSQAAAAAQAQAEVAVWIDQSPF